MNSNNLKAIKATVMGLMLASAIGGSQAGAAVRDAECVASTQQTRRACALSCVAGGNCSAEYRASRADCIANTVAGSERQGCFARSKTERTACQSQMRKCKAACTQDFQRAKDDCRTGN